MRRALVRTAVVLGLLVLVAPVALVAPAGKALAGDDAGGEVLRWGELPEIPPPPGRDPPGGGERQAGLAGPFVGVHEGALIVAGGANFPEALPWDGGAKVWWDDVYVLVVKEGAGEGEGEHAWHSETFKLPRPLAYGASVSTADGVVCIGGSDAGQCYPDVFLLKWDPAAKRLETTPLPPLPVPLADMGAALVGRTVYVVGGRETAKDAVATKHFLALDMPARADASAFKWKWRELPAWPGPARVLPVVAAQSDGTSDCLYVFSGRNITPPRGVAPGGRCELLADAYRFDPNAPEERAWKRVADVTPDGRTPPRGGATVCVMGAAATAAGANHILVFGGDDGRLFMEREEIGRALAATDDPVETRRLREKLRRNFTEHPGFTRDVLAYHTITDTWTRTGSYPVPTSQVVTPAVRWHGDIVIASGEVRPGVRTPKIRTVAIPERSGFGFVNYSVLVAYLLAMVAMGVYFSRRQKSTDDFFKAGGRIPWWAAGVSIFGTQLSALTFMGVPAKTFATDWTYFWGNMAIVMAAPFIVLLYLPFYRRLNVTTAYEYLERRFNLAARLLGSVMFILFQFGRIGIVLFLPSLALSVVTGINVSACILVMGVLCIVYAALGGIEAVIWTDVLQVIVLVGGGLLCLVVIAFQFPGGWDEVNDVAHAADKFRTFDFRLDITTGTFWVLLLGGFGANLFSYGADQTVIQRYLTTKDERSARRSIWLNAILCIPATLLFFMIGTALFAFFKTHPGEVTPAMTRPDGIFPWYIVTQLSPGLAGLLIAGVFAAAMSSLDSSMNSVATAVTTDFYRRFRPDAPDEKCLRLARIVTVVIGVLGTLFALGMVQWNIKSLWDSFAMVLGLFGGGLAGLFVLAIFTRRPGGRAAVIALIGSGAVQALLKWLSPMHAWFYAVTGLVSCFVIGVLAGMVVPEKRKDLEGLTVHSLKAGGE